MTITILELLNSTPVLNSLRSQRLSGQAALHVRRLLTKLAPEIADAGGARDSLMNDENSIAVEGGGRAILPEAIEDFIRYPLFQEKITVDIVPLTPADLAEAKISSNELDQLGPLFVDA